MHIDAAAGWRAISTTCRTALSAAEARRRSQWSAAAAVRPGGDGDATRGNSRRRGSMSRQRCSASHMAPHSSAAQQTRAPQIGTPPGIPTHRRRTRDRMEVSRLQGHKHMAAWYTTATGTDQDTALWTWGYGAWRVPQGSAPVVQCPRVEASETTAHKHATVPRHHRPHMQP